MRRILSLVAASVLLLALMNTGMWSACSQPSNNNNEIPSETPAEIAPTDGGEIATEIPPTEKPAENPPTEQPLTEQPVENPPTEKPAENPPPEQIVEDPPKEQPAENPPTESSGGNKLLGELCNVTSDCKSGLQCVDPSNLGKKVCTSTCTQDSDCPSDALCDKHPPLTSYCLPKCSTDAECSTVYSHIPLCVKEGHCWVPKPLGDACARDSACQTGLSCVDPGGLGEKVCSKTCTAAADCNTGGGICDASHPGLQTTYCLRPCTQDTDCSLYPGTPICSAEGHCWGRKNIGGTCTSNAQCQAGLDCKDPGSLGSSVCTKSCTADGDCPGGKCQNSQCLPRCTQDADCANFSTIFKCDTNGYCWKQ